MRFLNTGVWEKQIDYFNQQKSRLANKFPQNQFNIIKSEEVDRDLHITIACEDSFGSAIVDELINKMVNWQIRNLRPFDKLLVINKQRVADDY